MNGLLKELEAYIKQLIKENEDPRVVAENVKALAKLLTAKTCYEFPNYLPSEVSKERMEL